MFQSRVKAHRVLSSVPIERYTNYIECGIILIGQSSSRVFAFLSRVNYVRLLVPIISVPIRNASLWETRASKIVIKRGRPRRVTEFDILSLVLFAEHTILV